MAGILGPVLVNYVNQWQLAAGTPPARAYDRTMLILAGLLALGFVANLMIRPPAAEESTVPEARRRATPPTTGAVAAPAGASGVHSDWPLVAAFWSIIMLPLAWGTWQSLLQASVLLR